MSRFYNTIKLIYTDILPLLLPFSIFIILLYVGYRYEIYHYIKTIYVNMQFINGLYYTKHILSYDSITILFSILPMMLLLILLKNTVKLKYIVSAIYIATLTFFLLLSIEFFRVYETTFQKSFINNEHATGISDMVASTFSETSTGFYVKLFAILLALAFIIVKIYLKKEINIYVFNKNKEISRFKNVLFPALVALLIIFITISDSSSSIYLSKPGDNQQSQIKTASLINELAMNPVYNLFNFTRNELYSKKNIFTNYNEKFSFGLETRSLLSSKKYPRIHIPRGKKYNIIFYFFESTPYSYLDLKINDNYVTPTWHRLKKNSLFARNHYANYPLSANAMFSVLTSAYDMYSKDAVILHHPNIKIKGLNEILKAHGYRSLAIHTGDLRYARQRSFLQHRKFDKIIEYKDLKHIPPYNYRVGWGFDERAMIQPSIEFMQESAKPFFVVYLPVNPHHPYAIPHKKYEITGKIPNNISAKEESWLKYLNSLHFSDAALGELIDRLEKENLLENTLLFVFSDHGEAFYQHKRNYNHPFFLYEENVHIPLLIYNKKLFSKTIYYDGISRHIDITPTVLDALHIPKLNYHEGISVFSSHFEQFALLHTSWKDDYIGVRDGMWKYIYKTKDGSEELYNLIDDPEEKNNLAFVNKSVVKKYRDTIIKARRYKIQYFKKFLK